MLHRRHMLATLAAFPLAGAPQRVKVISHRGEHLAHPENTIPAIEAAIAARADYVEIDVRTTKDGQFVLMHDGTVDRMTNGKGNVSDFTFDELRALEVKFPGFSGVRIPTLDQALAAMRGKCSIYLDAKRIDAANIIASLKKNDMVDGAVVYGGLNLMKALSELGHPEICMPEAVSVEVSQRIVKELNLKVIAYDRRDFTPEIIAVAKAAFKGVFVDRLGPQDTPGHWREAIQMGATGIQTDRPAELRALVNSLA